MMIGYVGPEAAVGGPIALLQDGDWVDIDATQAKLDVRLSEPEWALRRTKWADTQNSANLGPGGQRFVGQSGVVMRRKRADGEKLNGVLEKYARVVGPAHLGAVTHSGRS
jgi:dihydroxy-acid dehydratase